MLHRNVENFIGCDSSYRTASIVLYGAPFDSTTSYRPGARFGQEDSHLFLATHSGILSS